MSKRSAEIEGECCILSSAANFSLASMNKETASSAKIQPAHTKNKLQKQHNINICIWRRESVMAPEKTLIQPNIQVITLSVCPWYNIQHLNVHVSASHLLEGSADNLSIHVRIVCCWGGFF